MSLKYEEIIMIAVSLILLGVVMPLGLAYVAGAGDMYIVIGGVNKTLSEWVDPSVLTLFVVLVPVLAVIGIAIAYVKMAT